MAKRMTGSQPDWTYDKRTQVLKLMPEPANCGSGKDNFILLTVN